MGRGQVFWGIILLLAGFVFLLDNMGLLGNLDAWNVLWPLGLIAFGIWTLWGSAFRRAPAMEHARVPLDGASRARVRMSHGAGRLTLTAGADMDTLLEGDFGGGLDLNTQKHGDELDVRMSVPVQVFPFSSGPGYTLDWNLRFNPEAALELELEAGAGETRLDLSELPVHRLRLKTGASHSVINLPASAGFTRADISSGAAQIDIHIPSGVAASIRTRGGLSSMQVDQARFPRFGDRYQSPDYDEALNKVELDVEMGVGGVNIR